VRWAVRWSLSVVRRVVSRYAYGERCDLRDTKTVRLARRCVHDYWIGGVELAAAQRTCTEELTQAKATTPAPIGNDPDLRPGGRSQGEPATDGDFDGAGPHDPAAGPP
jgi:hypothetical protein